MSQQSELAREIQMIEDDKWWGDFEKLRSEGVQLLGSHDTTLVMVFLADIAANIISQNKDGAFEEFMRQTQIFTDYYRKRDKRADPINVKRVT